MDFGGAAKSSLLREAGGGKYRRHTRLADVGIEDASDWRRKSLKNTRLEAEIPENTIDWRGRLSK